VAEIPAATLTYSLPTPARVTINLYDAQGRIVRELLGGEPREAGKHSEAWDGRDWLGRPLPPGRYTWKGLYHAPVKAKWITAVGNSGTPPYQTADGTGSWGGDHGAPTAVCADETGTYFLWNDAEAGMSAVKIDRNDKTVWRHRIFVFDCKTAIGADGKYVFIGIVRDGGDCVLARYDAATGRAAPFPSGREWLSLPQRAKLERGWTRAAGLRPGTPEPVIVPPEKPRTDPWIPRANYLRQYADNPGGIVLRDGKVYVSMQQEDKILVVDEMKGEVLSSIEVPRPRGLAWAPDGSLLAVSILNDETGRVVKIDPAAKTVTPLVTDGLEIPWALAADQTGAFYVTDIGDCQQVKKFSAEGKPLATFGRAGGRRWGKFVSADFREPVGAYVAPDGYLYIGESVAPKRFARCTLDGKIVKEWFGALGYAEPATGDPEKISDVYYCYGGQLVRCEVDYATGQWRVDAVWDVGQPEGINAGVTDMRVTHHAGRTYLYGEGHAHPLYIIDGYAIRQVASLGKHAGYLNPHSDNWRNETFAWYDHNGNGKVDAGELQVVTSPVGGGMNGLIGSFLTRSLVWYLPDFNRVLRLRPVQIDPSGAPEYTWDLKYTDIPVKALDSECGGESTGCEVDAAGNVYAEWNVPGETRARAYWGARTALTRLGKYAPDGKQVWEVGRHCSGEYIKPGEMYHLWKSAGLVDNWVFLTDTAGLYHIYSTDGFFIDTLMDDPTRPDTPPGPYSLMGENFCGSAVKDAKSGKIYLFATDTAAHIYEVQGLGDFPRLQGTVEIRTWPTFAGPTVAPDQPYPITRIARKSLLWREGLPMDWEGMPGMVLQADGRPVAQVKLAVDDLKLHILAQVLDGSPLKNTGDPAPMMYRGGDEVSVFLGCDAAADPARTAPVAGDVRLCLAAPNGANQVLLYRAVDPASTTPYEIQSPVGKVIFAWVGKPGEGYCAARVWADGRGYTLEADVPLASLPELAQSWGKTIKFDVEVGQSDAGGTKTVSRLVWHSRASEMAAAAVDAPTEAKLLPATWGTAQLPGA
jgi:hypothetical protein